MATEVDGVWAFIIYDAMGKMVCEYGGLNATDEGGVKYILKDWQGSSRAIIKNNGSVKARMDYAAFSKEIQNGIGLRTASQGFGEDTSLNSKYGLCPKSIPS